jgi:hypothetical protein
VLGNTLCILSGQSTNFVLLKSPLAGAECTNFLYAQPLIASGAGAALFISLYVLIGINELRFATVFWLIFQLMEKFTPRRYAL